MVFLEQKYAALLIEGRDTKDFLQAILTIDVVVMEYGQTYPTSLLNQKAELQFIFFIIAFDKGRFFFIFKKEDETELLTRLENLIFAEKVTLSKIETPPLLFNGDLKQFDSEWNYLRSVLSKSILGDAKSLLPDSKHLSPTEVKDRESRDQISKVTSASKDKNNQDADQLPKALAIKNEIKQLKFTEAVEFCFSPHANEEGILCVRLDLGNERTFWFFHLGEGFGFKRNNADLVYSAKSSFPQDPIRYD